ncbi:MAG: universal stress protein [Roseovarius sp.]|nr:universal stress protein [Roseovarius sp.]
MYTNILLPVVFDKDHDTEVSFQIARALAAKDAKFTLVHVMENIPSYAAVEIPEQVFVDRRAEADENLNAMAQKLPGASSTLISGHAGRAIVQYANDHDIDCIILASHKPGLENFFLGSTADRVVRHAKCAVHVIR